MTQTRLGSLIEVSFNIAIGFVIAIASQLVIFPMVGIQIAFHTNLEIAIYFTIVSVIRSYIVRRWFNARLHRAAERLAKGVNS